MEMEMSIEMKKAIVAMYYLLCDEAGDDDEGFIKSIKSADFSLFIRRWDRCGTIRSATFVDENYFMSIKPSDDGFDVTLRYGVDRIIIESPDMQIINGKLVINEVREGWTNRYIL